MVKPNNELGFAMADLYPNFGGIDTSTVVTREVEDQDALNEDVKVAEESSVTEAKGKNIFLAFMVLIALIVFFGGK